MAIKSLIVRTFPEEPGRALAIFNCESIGFQESVVGDGHLSSTKELKKTGDYGESIGIAQIRLLPGRPSRDYLLKPWNNIKYAREVYNRSGWQPWTCARNTNMVNPSQIQ